MNTKMNRVLLIFLTVSNILLLFSFLIGGVVVERVSLLEESILGANSQVEDLYSKRIFLVQELSSLIYKYSTEDADKLLFLANRLEREKGRGKSFLGVYEEISSVHTELALEEKFQNQKKELEDLENEIKVSVGKYNEQVDKYEEYCSRIVVRYCCKVKGNLLVNYDKMKFDSSVNIKFE